MKKRMAALFMMLLLALSACMPGGSYVDVDATEAQKMITDENIQVIDVRTPEEYAEGHIPDAKLVPLQELESRLNELDKDEKYVIVCRSGNRSTEASGILAENGFKNIYNMTGGMNTWTGEIVTGM